MAENSNFYFQSYWEWREAITERCNITLSSDYAKSRLSALGNPEDPGTREFTAKYGEDYLRQVIQWFEQAEREA